MNEVTKKVLESGLVDTAMAQMMEKWGVLPEGSSELTKNDRLKNATREQLVKFGEELGDALDRERRLKETMLDLNYLRWPAWVQIISTRPGDPITEGISGVIDRMGRYYFRPKDVKKEWFVPGYILRRGAHGQNEVILEVSELFVGDQVAALQVSVK